MGRRLDNETVNMSKNEISVLKAGLTTQRSTLSNSSDAFAGRLGTTVHIKLVMQGIDVKSGKFVD